MNEKFHDPIVAEVRKNREEMLAGFNGNTKKLTEYIDLKRSEIEAAGLRYETPEERQNRLTRNRKRREMEERRVASM